MNGAKCMRVMVSLNLGDIMTATRPTTSQPMYEVSNDEADATDSHLEPQVPSDPEPMISPTERSITYTDFLQS